MASAGEFNRGTLNSRPVNQASTRRALVNGSLVTQTLLRVTGFERDAFEVVFSVVSLLRADLQTDVYFSGTESRLLRVLGERRVFGVPSEGRVGVVTRRPVSVFRVVPEDRLFLVPPAVVVPAVDNSHRSGVAGVRRIFPVPPELRITVVHRPRLEVHPEDRVVPVKPSQRVIMVKSS